MPRTAIATQVDKTQAGQALAFVAVDAVNGMQAVNDGRVLVHVRCGAGDSVQVSIPSVACSHGRTGDITAVACGNNSDTIFGPFPIVGIWGDGASLLLFNFASKVGAPTIAIYEGSN